MAGAVKVGHADSVIQNAVLDSEAVASYQAVVEE